MTPPRAVFAPGRITLQMIQTGVVPFSAALIAVLEASQRDDVERNRLSPPNPAPYEAIDWIRTTRVTQSAHAAWQREPDVSSWLRRSRLNPRRGLVGHQHDPTVRIQLARLREVTGPALANLHRLERGIGTRGAARSSSWRGHPASDSGAGPSR